MAFFFERAFLQAMKRARIHHSARLKGTIQLFHQICSFRSQHSISNQLRLVRKPLVIVFSLKK